MTAAPAGPSHLRSLDGVRAIAAYAVIATHVGFNSGESVQDSFVGHALSRLDFGVTLFFLLSGYLLYRPFAAAMIAGTPAPRIGSFWRRRLVRIAPAYWLASAATLLLLSTRPTSTSDWRAYLTLTQTYSSRNVDPSLTQMWTLATEIAFYAVLPMIALLTRHIAPRCDVVRRQLAMLAALVATAVGADVVCHARGGSATVSLLWLPPNLDWFALGMLLAMVTTLPPGRLRAVDAMRTWALHAAGTCWIAGGLVLVLATLPLAGPSDLTPTPVWEWTMKHYLYALAAFFLLLPEVLGDADVVSHILGNRIMAWLGTVSYGVYLWHLPLLMALQRWLDWRTFQGHFTGLFALTALSATAAAALSWYLLERPLLRRWGRIEWRGGHQAPDDQRQRQQTQNLSDRASSQRIT